MKKATSLNVRQAIKDIGRSVSAKRAKRIYSLLSLGCNPYRVSDDTISGLYPNFAGKPRFNPTRRYRIVLFEECDSYTGEVYDSNFFYVERV